MVELFCVIDFFVAFEVWLTGVDGPRSDSSGASLVNASCKVVMKCRWLPPSEDCLLRSWHSEYLCRASTARLSNRLMAAGIRINALGRCVFGV